VFFGGFTAARSEDKGPGPSFWIAALGPGTSLAIGALLFGVSRATTGPEGPAMWLIGYVGLLNLIMAGFNVLPGLPLDGGRMLQAAVWRVTGNRTTGARVAARSGMVVGVLLLGLAAWLIASDDARGAVWLGIVGFFILQGARASDRQIGLSGRLAQATVADAMEPPPPAVPADLSLSLTLDGYLRGHEGEAFPVVDEGAVIGMISFSSARELGARDPLRPARDAMIPLDRVLVAHPDESLEDVAERLSSGRAALVLRDGRLVGAITGGGLHRWAGRAR
jgi:CBS domain-containing protein